MRKALLIADGRCSEDPANLTVLNERQVSACECAFRLCHLNLRDSSRRCIFLNTRKPTQRYGVLRFDDAGKGVGFCDNIFVRYGNRPDRHDTYDFASMTLMEFAMLFEAHYGKAAADNEDCVDEDVYEHVVSVTNRLLRLNYGSLMTIRNVPAVVRVPYFTMANDPENYFYSLLMQYMPYRSETELLDVYTTAKEAFLAREHDLKRNAQHMEIYRERDRQLEVAFNRVHAFEILNDAEPPDADDVDDVNEDAWDQRLDEDEYCKARRKMNAGRRELFELIGRSIDEQSHGGTERERLFITGGAGTGKTFVFKLLKEAVNRCYDKHAVKACTLTGVAARLVGGATLHSTFKLPVEKDGRIVSMPLLTGLILRTMRLMWRDIEFLFIHEIPMVPYDMLVMIDSRLKQLKNSEALFGGINVLVFGDLMQLPPVRGKQVFDQPVRFEPATNLWRLFSLVELKKNIRQQGDTTFVDILNALIVGKLNVEHMGVLLQKAEVPQRDHFAVEKALRIYPTRKQVDDHNAAVVQHFVEKGTAIVKIEAQDVLVNATRQQENVPLDSVVSKDVNKTGGLPKELEMFVGAKVLLRSNVDVGKGLVNGAIRVVTEIIWPHFRRAQMYATEIPSVHIDFGNDGIHVIEPRSVQFPALRSFGTIERRVLPLILSWASTVHKMQGSTVDYAVVYLGKKLFQLGQAYVALSRVKSRDGLCIEELDCSKLTGTKPCNVHALDEMERLRNLNNAS